MKTFYNKFNGVTLEDAGSYTSEEYKNFQKEEYKAMKKIAKEIGAEVVSRTYGHYFESFFFKRNGSYVYVHRGSLNRTFIDLDSSCEFLFRTAKDEKDYRGGCNNYCCYKNLSDKLNNLLE